MMFVDSHCHLDFDSFDDDREAVVNNAHTKGVIKMLTISTQIRRLEALQKISRKFDSVYATIGTHPRYAEEEKDITLEEIITLSQGQKIVAIGETGLDYHYDSYDKNIQKQVFITHIKAAQETGLPLIVHARNADKDVSDILMEQRKKKYFDILLHCYASGLELAETGKELGAWFSFSGIITFNKAQEIRDIAQTIDKDKILIETDAPYLTPAPYRSKRNEPQYIVYTAQKLADIRNVSLETLASQTTKNFFRLFKNIST